MQNTWMNIHIPKGTLMIMENIFCKKIFSVIKYLLNHMKLRWILCCGSRKSLFAGNDGRDPDIEGACFKQRAGVMLILPQAAGPAK